MKVGAATEIAMKEKKARLEDALHATRAAVEEGVVPGGGVALMRAGRGLDKLKGDNDDQTTGIKILRRSIEEPLRQIVANAGYEPSVIVDKVRAGKGNYGFDAATGEYGDMIELGILDPTKVTRLALQNAASVASLMLTTEALIADAPEKPKADDGTTMTTTTITTTTDRLICGRRRRKGPFRPLFFSGLEQKRQQPSRFRGTKRIRPHR